MGGNAFKTTKRLTEKNYRRVCAEISEILENLSISFGFPVETSDKAELAADFGFTEPYGDVDVVVGYDGDPGHVVDVVHRQVGGEDQRRVKHGSTFSFLTRNLHQVDIKFCPQESLKFMVAFKSNNDFGGLLGHLLSSLSIRMTDLGMLLTVKMFNIPEIGTVKSEVVLTKDTQHICHFLGLPDHCLDGKTRMSSEEIVNILINSKIFQHELYLTESYKKRHKVSRRPLSNKVFRLLETFHASEEEKHLLGNNLFQDFREEKILAEEYYRRICQYFDKLEELKKFYATCNIQKNKVEICKSKLSFKTLLEAFPGMKDEEAGNILRKMKYEKKENFVDWVTETDVEEILKVVETMIETNGTGENK